MLLVYRGFFSKWFLLRNDDWLWFVGIFYVIFGSNRRFLIQFRRFFTIYLLMIHLLLDTMNRFFLLNDFAWLLTLFTWGSWIIRYLRVGILVRIRMNLNFVTLGGFLRFMFSLLLMMRVFRRWFYWRTLYWFLDCGTGI